MKTVKLFRIRLNTNVMVALGCIGSAAAGYLFYRAGKSRCVDDTPADIAKDLAPALAVEAASVGLLVGAHALDRKLLAAMTSAYGALAADLYAHNGKNPAPPKQIKWWNEADDVMVLDPDGEFFYDCYTGCWFVQKREVVTSAFYKSNRQMAASTFRHTSLEDLYRMYGYDEDDDLPFWFKTIGWRLSDCYWPSDEDIELNETPWIDFSLDDGTAQQIYGWDKAGRADTEWMNCKKECKDGSELPVTIIDYITPPGPL